MWPLQRWHNLTHRCRVRGRGRDIGGSCGWSEVIIEEDLGASGCGVEEGVGMVS